MKIIQVLLVLLIVAVAALAWQISVLPQSIEDRRTPQRADSPPVSTDIPAHSGQPVGEPADSERIAATVRAVIRDELSRLDLDTPGESVTGHQVSEANRPEFSLSALERQNRQGEFEQMLEHYRSLGSMTADEVADLELLIARLHPDDRRTAMNQFNSAISSGELDARF